MSLSVICGTMLFGQTVSEEGSVEQLNLFKDHKFLQWSRCQIDTARNYQLGATEELLGKIRKEGKFNFNNSYIATKINAFGDQGKNFSPESVKRQVNESLAALNVDCVDLIYLHAPDYSTPIEVTLEALNQCHKEGKFKEFGLSNYAAWQVVQIYYICKANNYVLPTVYQGMYNAITRDVEKELIPALRALNMKFYVYNPLAGGLLAGRYSSLDDNPGDGRFGGEMADRYKARFWKNAFFDALDVIRKACNEENLSMTDASLRWLHHHSKLSANVGDGIILGASKTIHLEQNLNALTQGPLTKAIVEAFDAAWECARPQCPPYNR